MPLQKLQFRPGVNREGTTLSNEGGWYDCDKVRFRSGYPEKIGGWAVLSYNTFLGVCRSLWGWITLKSYNLLGVGTNLKFYVENGGEYYDITPLRETNTNPSGQITLNIENGSSLLTIIDTNADSLQVNDFITIAGAVDLGSAGTNVTAAVLNQEYQIVAVFSGTSYQIRLREAVSGDISTTNGGAILVSNRNAASSLMTGLTIAYQINTGFATYTVATGWGASPWGGFISDVKSTALNGALTSTATTITVTSTTGFPTGSVSVPALILVGDASNPTNETFLPAQINSSVTTIDVGSTYGFSSSGSILINTEIITYTGITATTFTGCTRGASGSTAATQNAGSIVYQNKLELITHTGVTSTTFTGATRGAEGTSGTIFATGTVVDSANTFPGWGEGYTTTFGFQLRLWSQMNFGEYLIFNPRGGPLYIWQPGPGATPTFNERGVILSPSSVTPSNWVSTVTDSSCPVVCNQLMVSDSTRILVAFGCNDYGETTIDPLLIRWSEPESYADWAISPIGQAGSYRLSHGSEIIGAFQTRQEIVVFTDAAIYSMQFLGPPFVWGFTLLADNISIASPNAVATAAGVVYWMGTDKFYVYSGRVETLPCSVRQYIFSDINRDQEAQFFAGTNEGYSEIWWFYCSANSTAIDRYVIFNYLDRVWYYGTMGRTAWIDSPLRQFPQATTYLNNIVLHEAAVDDGSTNPPSPISAYVQSSDFDIGDGHNYGFVWRVIPDITFDGSTASDVNNPTPQVKFTLRPRQNPGSNYGVANSPDVESKQNYAGQQTYNVQQFTEIVYTRLRGRQMAFKIESNTLGTQWQLGVPRADVRPDGRR